MLYKLNVRRFLFLIVLGILSMDAAGLEALVSPEPCSAVEDAQPDGKCPPLCARCGCGVQVIVPALAPSLVASPARQPFIDLYSRGIPRTLPAKVFHVPKFASSTI